MNAPVRLRMPFDQYVEWEERQERKHELVDGEVRLMPGGTTAHGLIALNAAAALRTRLRGKPCKTFGSDVKVRIPKGNARYPDVTVDCGRPKSADLWAAEPRVIIEVLSASTEWFDQTQKLEEYQSIPSVAHIAFFSQTRAFGRVWTRASEGWTSEDAEGLGASFVFSAIETDLPLAEVYEDVEFETGAE